MAGLGPARGGGRCRPPARGSGRSRPRFLQPPLLVRTRRLPVRRRRRRGRRRPRAAAEPDPGHLAAEPGARRAAAGNGCSTWSTSACSPRMACARSTPGHPDYKSRYFGDLRSRDAAYHQGTVWAWLIGPFIDAWLKVHPEDRTGARRFLTSLRRPPRRGLHRHDQRDLRRRGALHPRGCVAQAWSVAEVLRTWIRTAPEREEAGR